MARRCPDEFTRDFLVLKTFSGQRVFDTRHLRGHNGGIFSRLCRSLTFLIGLASVPLLISRGFTQDASTLMGVSGWQELARTPIANASPKFRIEGRLLQLPGDEPAIIRYFRTKTSHAYTQHWLEDYVYRYKNEIAGEALLEKHELRYGNYEPVPIKGFQFKWDENPYHNLNWPWFHHHLMSVHFL